MDEDMKDIVIGTSISAVLLFLAACSIAGVFHILHLLYEGPWEHVYFNYVFIVVLSFKFFIFLGAAVYNWARFFIE